MIILFVLIQINFCKQHTIDIFIESQCPDTIRLFKKMKPLINNEIIYQLIHFNFIPFGKANEKLIENIGYQFTCQHQQIECYGNLIDSCVLEQLINPEQQLQYLTCIHEKRQTNEQMINLHLQRCLEQFECVYERTLKCISSKYGNYLQHKAAKITLAQNLSNIPWINVNGSHDQDFDYLFQQNPIKAICTILDCQKNNIQI